MCGLARAVRTFRELLTQQLVEMQSRPLVERLPAHMDTEGEARPGAEACPASHQLALGRLGAPHCPSSMGNGKLPI